MIGGARIRLRLDAGNGTAAGGDVEVVTRPVDLFTAEAALGFDPLTEIASAGVAGSTRALRGLIALAWAAYCRDRPADPPSLEAFTAALVALPDVIERAGDDRPTPAAVSTVS